jgi:hypothetical protein
MNHLLTHFAVWLIVRCAIKRAEQGIKEGVFLNKQDYSKPVSLRNAVHDTLEGDLFEWVMEDALMAASK